MEMVNYNVLYENDKSDVDIICVPVLIADKMEILCQEFLDWLPYAKNDIYWTVIDGEKISVCETEGFVEWLNSKYCDNIWPVAIINKHVHFVEEYKTIEF